MSTLKAKMKIIVISPSFPLPPNSGDRIRTYNLVKELSKNHSLTLLSLSNPKENTSEKIGQLKTFCQDVLVVPHTKRKFQSLVLWLFSSLPYRHVRMRNKNLRRLVEDELSRNAYDVVICECLDSAQNIRRIARRKQDTLFVLDQQNEEGLWFESFVRSGSFPVRLFGRENIRRLKNIQNKEYECFDLCISASNKDAIQTQKVLAKPPEVLVVPNGVDTDLFLRKGDMSKANVAIFCGSMDITMNQDAVLHFCRNILPTVKKKVPDVQFVVVGRNPPLIIRNLSRIKGVRITGTVEDVRPFYEQARVMVAPLRLGGGTKLKITEAMAMRVPIVSTTIGCQGIDAQSGKHLWIADPVDCFAEKVIQTLTVFPEDMVEEAHKLVHQRYSWRHLYRELEQVLYERQQHRR